MKKTTNFIRSSFMFMLLCVPIYTWADGYFVCYQVRYSASKHYGSFYEYKGCTTSYLPCDYQEMKYFGEYYNRPAMLRAYQRCVHSNPRYID